MNQLEIDFSTVVSHKENNSFSEAILEANLPRIGAQCKKVLELLNSGERLTVNGVVRDYNISSLPRRIKDCEQKLGIKINREVINGKYVEYFI